MTAGLHRTTAALSAAALLSLSLVTAGAAQAANTPPFEPDPNASGTLSFYDATGQVITSGRTDSGPFAAYVVGSAVIRAGDTQAAYYFANPDSAKTTNKYNVAQPGVFTPYPTTAAPAAINTVSATRPVATGTAKDETLDAFESTAVKSSTAGYVNVVQVRLRTYSPNAAPVVGTHYESADIRIDPTSHTWTEIYPTAAGTTVPDAPTQVRATAGSTSATVTWTAPTADGGAAVTSYQVEYSRDGTTFTKAPRMSTTTSATVTGLTAGVSYLFRVEAVNSVGSSAPSAVSNRVTPTASPTALSISATASVRYGSTATVAARLTDQATRGALGRLPITLYGRGRTGGWRAIKNVTTSTSGSAAVALKPASYEQFYWHFSGNTMHRAVNSAVKVVTVSQIVAAKATATKVKAKKLIKVYGTVGPVGTGQRVYLQVYSHGWKTVTSATLRYQTLPNHKRVVGFVLGVRPRKGSKTYRVYKAATSTLLAGASSQFKLAGK